MKLSRQTWTFELALINLKAWKDRGKADVRVNVEYGYTKPSFYELE